jgi:hypothetical protein
MREIAWDETLGVGQRSIRPAADPEHAKHRIAGNRVQRFRDFCTSWHKSESKNAVLMGALAVQELVDMLT